MYNKTLDTFKIAADSGSFTKASEQLFISHTAVIKQINSLEAHLGVKLFKRTNHGILLTAAGQRLYEKTLEISAFSEKAIQEIQEVHFASPKTIRVGTSLFYPCHIFMDLWDSVSERCPGYQLKIVPIENDEHRFSGLGKSYDFIVGPYNSEVSGVEYPFIPIGEYRFCLSMPRKHLLAKRKTLCLDDLQGQQLMIMRQGNSAVNDQIRFDIETSHHNISLIDIPPHYSIHTFNRCAESNAVLLSLECWKDVHPGLITVPLEETYKLPYGILTPAEPAADVANFIAALEICLKKKYETVYFPT
ncbi:MAG: LysR family transcriptional regulator [Clostridium sp.]|nr:LysR family transcriptional regulator [Clostridium sp.]